jgi:hypothetical protein
MDPLRSLMKNEFIYQKGEDGKKQRKRDETKYKMVDGNVVGRLHRIKGKNERYEVMWTATSIQNTRGVISRSVAIKGINYFK